MFSGKHSLFIAWIRQTSKNRLCGRNAKVFNVVADARCGNQRALKVNLASNLT